MSEQFIGQVQLFAFGVVPRGWVPCDGRLLPINQNVALYSLLGNRYGGDGVTNFAVPNLAGRVPVHPDQSIRLGQQGGERDHTLTLSEIPNHTHQVIATTADAKLPAPKDNVWAQNKDVPLYHSAADTTLRGDAISFTGGSQAHANMQPYLALQYCIAVQGIFPTRD